MTGRYISAGKVARVTGGGIRRNSSIYREMINMEERLENIELGSGNELEGTYEYFEFGLTN